MKMVYRIAVALAVAGGLMAQTPAPSELPRPSGFKAIVELPQTSIYTAPGSEEETLAAIAESFAAAGWVPYGEAKPIRYFKKGKVRATVMVGAPPEGKTTVNYSAEAIGADIPAPENATDLQYSDESKRLVFRVAQSPEEVDIAYRKLLAPAGWATKMEGPVKDELDYEVLYRHPSEGLIRLTMRPGEGTMLVTASYQTQAEVDAEEARAAAQGKALKAKLAAEASAPLPEVSFSLPKGMSKHFPLKGGLAIQLKPGSAMAGAQKIVSEIEAQGWKLAQTPPLAKETGLLELNRDSLRLSIVYVDPGMVPAEITITAPGVALKARP